MNYSRCERIEESTMRAKTVLVAGLATAAVGTLLEYVTGVPGFPTVPPGPIILAAAAIVVAVVAWRWIAALGVLAAAFVAVGAVASGVTVQLLATPEVPGQFVAALVQVLGLVAALVGGGFALVAAPVPARP
jgi:hypothetical protein